MASSLNGDGPSTVEIMEACDKAFQRAKEFNLELEVFATAFVYLKQNPYSTIQDALEVGLSDWDL